MSARWVALLIALAGAAVQAAPELPVLAAGETALHAALVRAGVGPDAGQPQAFCTLTIAGAAYPVVLLVRAGADGTPLRTAIVFDAALDARLHLDFGSGTPVRCSGARMVIHPDVRLDDGRRLDGPVLRFGDAARSVATDGLDDANRLPIEPGEPEAAALADRPAAPLQQARALTAAAIRRAGVAPKGQTLAGWQPLCTLASGERRVPVFGWLALALPKVAPGEYVPPARGRAGLLLTDAALRPLLAVETGPTSVLACAGARLRLAQPLVAGDCRALAPGARCTGDGDRLELAPDARTLTLTRSSGAP